MSKARAVAGFGEFLEAEIGRNIHELKHKKPASPQQEDATGETLADNLGMLFRRITERATREIEALVDELQSLGKKLEADRDLIERAIERHSQLSQGAMQLTTMLADNVKRLPNS
jgi:hypothetical protein